MSGRTCPRDQGLVALRSVELVSMFPVIQPVGCFLAQVVEQGSTS